MLHSSILRANLHNIGLLRIYAQPSRIRSRLGIYCFAAYRDKGFALVFSFISSAGGKEQSSLLMRLRQDVKAKPLLHAAKLHHVFFYEEATIPWRIVSVAHYGKEFISL